MVEMTGLESQAAFAVHGNNYMSLLLRKRWTDGSNPAENLNKKQQMQKCVRKTNNNPKQCGSETKSFVRAFTTEQAT